MLVDGSNALFDFQWSKFNAANCEDDDGADVEFSISDEEDDEGTKRPNLDIWSQVEPTTRTNTAFKKYLQKCYDNDDDRECRHGWVLQLIRAYGFSISVQSLLSIPCASEPLSDDNIDGVDTIEELDENDTEEDEEERQTGEDMTLGDSVLLGLGGMGITPSGKVPSSQTPPSIKTSSSRRRQTPITWTSVLDTSRAALNFRRQTPEKKRKTEIVGHDKSEEIQQREDLLYSDEEEEEFNTFYR